MHITREQARKLGLLESDYVTDPAVHASRKEAAETEAMQGRDKEFDLLCEAHGLPIPVKEYYFAKPRQWRFDYLFDGWLALEVEGGIFGVGKPCPVCKRKAVGAHSSIQRLKSDMEKYNAAAALGYVVIRCLPEDVRSGAAFALVKAVLKGDGAP